MLLINQHFFDTVLHYSVLCPIHGESALKGPLLFPILQYSLL